MTSIISIKTKDGILVAADTQVSSGNTALPFPYMKIQTLDYNIIAGSGSVGYLQRLLSIAKKNIRIEKAAMEDSKPIFLSLLSEELANLNFNLPLEHKHFSPFSFLLAGTEEDGTLSLITVGEDGSQIEIPNFFAIGSGGDYALSILNSEYNFDMDLIDGRDLLMKALNQSGDLDVFTNKSFQILCLKKTNDTVLIEDPTIWKREEK